MIRPVLNIFVNNFLNNVLRMHKICLNFVLCDMSLWSYGGSTGVNSASPDNDSSITFGSAKSPQAYNSEHKFSLNLPVGQNVQCHVHSGHIHVSFVFY